MTIHELNHPTLTENFPPTEPITDTDRLERLGNHIASGPDAGLKMSVGYAFDPCIECLEVWDDTGRNPLMFIMGVDGEGDPYYKQVDEDGKVLCMEYDFNGGAINQVMDVFIAHGEAITCSKAKLKAALMTEQDLEDKRTENDRVINALIDDLEKNGVLTPYNGWKLGTF